MRAKIEHIQLVLTANIPDNHYTDSSFYADLWSKLYMFLTREAQPIKINRIGIEYGITASMSVVGCGVSLSNEDGLKIMISCDDPKLALALAKKIQEFLENYEYKPAQTSMR